MSDHRLEILTPSYAADFELCRELVRSVHEFGSDDLLHTLVVPPRDVALFSELAGPRVLLRSTADLLPRGFVHIPGVNGWINVRRPFPPVRGWIAQQIVKLAAAARSSADAVMIVDSDIQFLRPFSANTFMPDGRIPLYRLPHAVDATMPRHMIWDDVAHRLLGRAVRAEAVRPDYICWPCVWEPATVRALLSSVAEIAGTTWQTAIAGELHFSEMVLYGVFVDALGQDARPPTTTDLHCLCYSDEKELDAASLDRMLVDLGADDVAVMISARSGTDLSVRRDAIARAVAGPAQSA